MENNEIRFGKMEEKVDNLKEDLSELKTDLKLHILNMETFIKEHQKDMKEIKPIVEEFNFNQLAQAKKKEFVKVLKTRLSLLTVLGGLFATSCKFISELINRQ